MQHRHILCIDWHMRARMLSVVQTLQVASQGRSSSSNGIIIIRPAVNTPNSTIGRLIIVTVILCT